jgi:ribosomal protein S27E
MNIYTQDLTEIQNLSTANYSVDELINRFNHQTLFGNSAQNAQCVICVKVSDYVKKEVGGKISTPEYSERLSKILLRLGNMKRSNFNKNVVIGRWLIKQNDLDNYNLSKTEIKARIDQEQGKTINAPRTKKPKSDYLLIIAEKDQEIVSLKEQLKQEQANNDIIVEHCDKKDSVIHILETGFVILADYLDDRDINWRKLLDNNGAKNPLDNPRQ